MTDEFDVDVLIAGAGPTGLTLAVDLARRGVSYRLIEKAEDYFDGSRGDGLQPRTLEVFEDLGVLPEILAAGGLLPPDRFYRGTELIREDRMFEVLDSTPDVPYPNPWALAQWRTEQILRDRLARSGGRVELGAELTGFEQDSAGVTAFLGRGERIRARYLVGADGGRSVVRKTLGVAFLGETHDAIRLQLADLRIDGLDRAYGYGWQVEQSWLALTPVLGTDQFVLIRPLTPDEEADASLPGLQKLLDHASTRSDLVIRDVGWHTVWRPNIRMVERYRVGRVFLAGDAAHVHPPTGGQGLNTGVQDAYNLGWKLSAVLGGAPEELLDSYQDERLPIAAGVLGLATKTLRKYQDDEAGANKRGREFHQLDLSYRDGPLARDLRPDPAGLVAGDRAPDAVLADGTRLFEAMSGPHWTLAVFGENRTELMPEAIAGRLRTVAVPAGSPGYDGIGGIDGALVLIRPDGYVGLISTPGTLSEVMNYLN